MSASKQLLLSVNIDSGRSASIYATKSKSLIDSKVRNEQSIVAVLQRDVSEEVVAISH
jgi:hypothetical protein